MATTFTKNQQVRLKSVVPQGPVVALRMSEDGVVSYLVEWTTAEGVKQSRWFEESELEAV
jgi:uncharacterized protein YodC (DUF2158 family)